MLSFEGCAKKRILQTFRASRARSAFWDHDDHTVAAGREEPVAREGDAVAKGKKWLTLAPKKTQMDRFCVALAATEASGEVYCAAWKQRCVWGPLVGSAPMLWSQQPCAYQPCPVHIIIGVISTGGSDSHSF